MRVAAEPNFLRSGKWGWARWSASADQHWLGRSAVACRGCLFAIGQQGLSSGSQTIRGAFKQFKQLCAKKPRRSFGICSKPFDPAFKLGDLTGPASERLFSVHEIDTNNRRRLDLPRATLETPPRFRWHYSSLDRTRGRLNLSSYPARSSPYGARCSSRDNPRRTELRGFADRAA